MASQRPDPATRIEIEDLAVGYARGTDAIGSGDLERGKAIYRTCFTDDARTTVYFPGTPSAGEPDFSTVGTDSWADFVAGVFSGAPYTATQHLMGSFFVQLDGDGGDDGGNVGGERARMESYLHATHVRTDGTVDIANGTYTDSVVKVNGEWRIAERTLHLLEMITVGSVVAAPS